MLVLSRKKNEAIVINDDITIVVVEIRGDRVRLGVEVPKEVPTRRRELFDAIHHGDTMEPKIEEPMKSSGKPCPKCGHANLVRVISCKGRLSEKNRRDIEAGTAILGLPGKKGPLWVCLQCAPEWSEVHDLAMESHDLQIAEKDAIKTASRCRKGQAKLQHRLAVLSKKLLRRQ